MNLENEDLKILDKALGQLKSGFQIFPDTLDHENVDVIDRTLQKLALRLQDNYPYFQPNYAGQMLKPPHAIARLAYMLALYINPNNHALDGSRATSPMEKECVQKIAHMFGWDEALGHLTSGGTMANLEALWVAKKCHPSKCVVASELAHYTHHRISSVLELEFQSIETNKMGQMDLTALENKLRQGGVGTVIVTLGTTGIGSLDPLTDIVQLQSTYEFRIHVDAAYGGYFILAENLSEHAKAQYKAMVKADSIVIDPHKHGLQPYGCGCILFKDRSVGQFYKHDSPYTYFSSDELHLGEISLECSRAGAAAASLWATMELFPLVRRGNFAQSLEDCHQAALILFNRIKNESRFISLVEPEIDIVVWGVKAKSISEMSHRASMVFNLAAEKNLHLALIDYPVEKLPKHWNDMDKDQPMVKCLRSCLMKPEHLHFIDELWDTLTIILDEIKLT